MHKVIMRCLITLGSGMFSPIPPNNEPDFLEDQLPGGTLDEAQMDCAAMTSHHTGGTG